MVSVNLPEPVLSLALAPVGKIKQNDELAVGGLWSVLSKVKSAVTDGRRLENLTWRLWYQARKTSKEKFSMSLVQRSPIGEESPSRPPLLSSPSLTLSCSSEDTNASSDWDREMTVNNEEDVGAHRNAVVSPLSKSLQFARSSAPLGVASSPQAIKVEENDGNRQLPLAPTQLWPHHLVETIPVRPIEKLRAQESAASSDARNQSSTTTALTSYFPVCPQSQRSSFNTVSCTTSLPSGQAVANNHPPSPMPIIPVVHQENQTVGKLVATVLSDKTMASRFARNVGIQTPPRIPQDQAARIIPEIVEPVVSGSYTQPGANSPLSVSSASASATSTPRQIFPTVVVVNPTPHPTPPATPSQDITESLFNPVAATFPINLSEKPSNSNDAEFVNGQLATPNSFDGNANPAGQLVAANNHMDEARNEIRPGHAPHERCLIKDNEAGSNTASTIVLPEKMEISSHLPTPAAELSYGLSPTGMGSTNRATSPAPISAPQPVEEKKFFLAAPRSGSGGSSHSTESPDSTRMASLSPSRRGGIHRASVLIRESERQRESQHLDEETASSFSACSPLGRAPSVASSKSGVTRNGATFTVTGSSSRRRQGGRKTALFGRDNHRRENSQTDYASDREKHGKDKAKEKVKAKETDTSHAIIGHRTKSFQHIPSHRSNLVELAPHQLRQLPTNPPPPRQTSPSRRNITPVTESRAQASTTVHHNKLLPLGNIPLGHLPTVPPRQRRPIEITSSDYSMTDTDDGGSSWESESFSGEDGKQNRLTNLRDVADGPSNTKNSDVTSRNNHANDPGAIARDAALEAQRQRDLFRKLPPRSYSNLGQLPRTKSGISILFNPDPQMLPEGHPYKTSRSSHDLLSRNWSTPAPPLAMTSITKRVGAAAPIPDTVTVASVNSKTDLAGVVNGRRLSGPQGNGYRPRAKPADQEEETETDEDPEDAIQVSNSVAERRLAALVGARTRRSPPQATNEQSQSPPVQLLTRIATMPVDMMRQYLVEPAPLQTPHTIRKNIISQELNEDLRRTLLSERSYNNQIQGRPPRAPGSILPGPWRPLTALKPTAEEQKPPENPSNRSFATQRNKSWTGDFHAHGW